MERPPPSPTPPLPEQRPQPRTAAGPWPLALALAAGAALVAATWLVAQWSWQARLRALEAEVTLLRGTRQLDLPRLLTDLQRLAGPAADRLALRELQERHARLTREQAATRRALDELRRRRRLEERFTLTAGASRDLLNGRVPLVVERLEDAGAVVRLAGAPASLWRPNDVRDLNFGGGRFRLTLEELAGGGEGGATFRLDALPEAAP